MSGQGWYQEEMRLILGHIVQTKMPNCPTALHNRSEQYAIFVAWGIGAWL